MKQPPLRPVEIGPDQVDTVGLRRALGRYATGVTVVTTRAADGTPVGLTINSFTSISLDPPLVLWSLRRAARSFEAFRHGGHFAVSVLAAGQERLARSFTSAIEDRFAGARTRDGMGGCPLIEDCLAHFECQLESVLDGGDHAILIGRVLKASQREGEPLVFASGGYCTTRLLGTAAAAAAE